MIAHPCRQLSDGQLFPARLSPRATVCARLRLRRLPPPSSSDRACTKNPVAQRPQRLATRHTRHCRRADQVQRYLRLLPLSRVHPRPTSSCQTPFELSLIHISEPTRLLSI